MIGGTVMSDGLGLVLRRAFGDLGLHRIEANLQPGNTRSRRLFERAGFRLSEDNGGFEKPGPLLGQHNREVLGDVLGLSMEEIERLIEENIVA